MRPDRGSSSVSTITSLFLDQADADQDQSRIYSSSMRTPTSYNARYNDRVYKSASKVLEDYIHNFDKCQNVKLAKSLSEICKTPLQKQALKQDPSTLEREIQMAKLMLPDGYESLSREASTLVAEDLLLTAPTFEHLSSDSKEHKNEKQSSMHNLRSSRKLKHSSKPTICRVCRHKKSESCSDDGSDSTISTSTSMPESGQFCSTRKGRSQSRKALIFSDEDYTTEEESTHRSTYRRQVVQSGSSLSSEALLSSRSLSSLNDKPHSDITMQIEDVRKTWQLVDDLKADLTASGRMINGNPKPPDESLVDLIERLSATAVRKEEKLCHEMEKTSMKQSLHFSDLASTHLYSSSPTRNKSVMRDTNGEAHQLSEVDPYTLNGVNYTPHTVKYANLASLQDRKLSNSAPASPAKRCNDTSHLSSVKLEPSTWHRIEYAPPSDRNEKLNSTTTTDNVSEVIRIIEQRQNKLQTILQRSDEDHSGVSRSRSSEKKKDVLSTFDLREDPSNESFWKAEMDSPPSHLTLNAGQTPFKPHHKPRSNHSSPSTEQLLDGDRTWERVPMRRMRKDDNDDTSSHISVSFCMEGKSTAVKDFMEECLNGDAPKLSGGRQPGSVEAIKNMIFTLQGLGSSSSASSMTNQDHDNDVIIRADMAGERSLRRAMSHLRNLKEIVEK
ncbi:unnamed protein product [Clavelina lepadiformis]|uniref:Uncharacterized protein n=1 Tax=Clavelina lepadiformis TaxID=159417 RepID=A0ABP0FFC3_CLALP